MIRRAIVSAAVVVSMLFVARAQAALVGYWAFDDPVTATTAQASVGGVDGALFGDAQFTGTGGVHGGAIQTTNGYVDMGDNFSISSVFSLQAWVNTVNTTDFMIAVSKHWAGTPNGYWIGANSELSPTRPAEFYAASDYGYHTAYGGLPVNDGQWHQLVGVYDGGGTYRLYVDGAFVASGSGGCSNNTAHFLVGGAFYGQGSGGTFTFAFSGLIDEVKIWDNALTADEVQVLYDGGGPTPTATGTWGMVKRLFR